ncbi:hypothetical protein PtA15_15A254 [Puccinia triticina]|uniref:Uncharacterized protein n=1 Tax=Puccinia triticina TaxID=208348 RepID=A0ABY7D6G1_9BASI|nr:uncharacterized protein PtA15_15A254 [Puccinia triticina]WAQ91862.1 hypothetical protein PtA15_15A254 [Puccinia triticina]
MRNVSTPTRRGRGGGMIGTLPSGRSHNTFRTPSVSSVPPSSSPLLSLSLIPPLIPPSSSMGGWISHTSPGRHKNPWLESVSPSRCDNACEWCQEALPDLPLLGVEHLGTLEQYIGICNIGLKDVHTRILLEHNKITHWTYFRRVHPDNPLMMKFAEGPAQQLCDGIALWVATLQKNRQEIENEVKYASNR